MDDLVDRKIIAVIPARGGSKRIPKKNIIDLNGKPMIGWTIEAALNSNYIDEVLVSTDDEDIATIAKEFGAKVPFLRDCNSDDYSPISLATIKALHQWELDDLGKHDIVVQLMANCPLRNSENIDDAIRNFINNDIEFQLSCFKYGWMNPWWAHTMNKSGLAKPLFDDSIRVKRSQDLEELYCPTGAIWIAKTESLIKNKTFYGDKFKFFPMNWIKAIDIDDYDDLEMANFFIEKMINKV